MEGLIDAILACRCVAFVGVAKNCGKTTTMNAVTKLLKARDTKFAILSIGIDGETRDALLGTIKPPVDVHVGQLVVTTDGAIAASDASFINIEPLAYETPIGRPCIAEVSAPGTVLLAGIRHRNDVIDVVDLLKSRVDVVLIDGAYGRVMAAHAAVADGVVVSTGAVVSPRVKDIVTKTMSLIDRLSLPEPETAAHRALIETAVAEDWSLVGLASGEFERLPARSLLVGLPKFKRSWRSEHVAIAAVGLVSDRVIEMLTRESKTPLRTLILSDATSLHAGEKQIKTFRRKWALAVRTTVDVVGLAVNPTSVQGHVVSNEHLIGAFREVLPKKSVVNPVLAID